MVIGFEIGHHTADGNGWLTGTTVVLARDGAVGGVDVRGGGPGRRAPGAARRRRVCPAPVLDGALAVAGGERGPQTSTITWSWRA